MGCWLAQESRWCLGGGHRHDIDLVDSPVKMFSEGLLFCFPEVHDLTAKSCKGAQSHMVSKDLLLSLGQILCCFQFLYTLIRVIYFNFVCVQSLAFTLIWLFYIFPCTENSMVFLNISLS